MWDVLFADNIWQSGVTSDTLHSTDDNWSLVTYSYSYARIFRMIPRLISETVNIFSFRESHEPRADTLFCCFGFLDLANVYSYLLCPLAVTAVRQFHNKQQFPHLRIPQTSTQLQQLLIIPLRYKTTNWGIIITPDTPVRWTKPPSMGMPYFALWRHVFSLQILENILLYTITLLYAGDWLFGGRPVLYVWRTQYVLKMNAS